MKFFCLCALFFYVFVGYSQFGPRQTIKEDVSTVREVVTADIDNDGDLDIVASAFDLIAWYENLDTSNEFDGPKIIQEGKGTSFRLYPADIDGDFLTDVVVSYSGDDEVVWYRNLGDGTFSSSQLVSDNLQSAFGIVAADVDGDLDMDLVMGVTNGNGLFWAENLDGLGNFGARVQIDVDLFQARKQEVMDIDGDGDLDILTNSAGDTRLSWYENVDGLGSFTIEHVVEANGLYENSINLVDVDGDTDLDIVSEKDDEVIWRENLNGLGDFGPAVMISSGANTIYFTTVADVDNDNDMDVLTADSIGNAISWYENLDGLGTFGSEVGIGGFFFNVQTLHLADLDNDGDQDLLTASLQDKILYWYENLTILGVDEASNIKIQLLPNPVNNELSIVSGELVRKVRMHDVLGRLWLEETQELLHLDVSELPTGMYIVELETDKGVFVSKVVKE